MKRKDIASARIGITIIGEERLCSGRLVHKRQSTGHDGFHKIRKAFCVLSRLFGYAAEKCSDFLCFNDANCFPISTEQIIGFALLRSMSPRRDLMLCANILLTIGVVPPAKRSADAERISGRLCVTDSLIHVDPPELSIIAF